MEARLIRTCGLSKGKMEDCDASLLVNFLSSFFLSTVLLEHMRLFQLYMKQVTISQTD